MDVVWFQTIKKNKLRYFLLFIPLDFLYQRLFYVHGILIELFRLALVIRNYFFKIWASKLILILYIIQ
jgi:hypothetical protein